ncbi:MAG: TolC family protein [Proteobacteria bacterium]|nr:TolC family protein [Pseudomonadota bacterium]
MSTTLGNTLEDFFTAAINYSPRLRIAQENLNIGSARKRAANGQLLPQLNANASISDNRRTAFNQLEEFDGERYSVQLTQILFNWQAFSARSQAYLVEDQREAEYYYELAWLLTDVADKYLNVLLAEDALDSIASELEAVTNQRNQIQSYYDRQLAQITDLYQVQASEAAVQSEQLQLQSDLALSREALRSTTGVSAGPLYRLSDQAQLPRLENSIDYWVQQARQGNHQIRAREFALRAADEHISEQRGAYMPRVTFIVQRQDTDLGFDNRPINQTKNTYVGLDISIPLFAGGRNRAAVSEATSLRSIAENELRQVQLEADEQVRTAYLQVQSSETRTQAAQKLVESTALSATAMQRGFELGTVTNVDVLNALRDQYRAERDLQRTRYEHVYYLLLLKRETGLLTADDMLEVGSWLVAPEV